MHTRMLAVAFGPATMAAACAGLERIRASADCVELRLDLFEEPFDLEVLLRERGELPLVATLRPPEQGGRCELPAAERLKVLVRAAELGAEYVDLEWDAADAAAQSAARSAGAQVIISRHDFAGMPHLADHWWPDLAGCGADVVKVVGTATEARDCLEVLRTLRRAESEQRQTIAIAMGEAGLMTRVLALGSTECLLTYVSLEAGRGTAPGQITLSDMRETYRADRIGSTTRVFGLLGPHVERDRLAEYNQWFAEDSVAAVAVPVVASSSSAEIVSAFREVPVGGWHIHGGEMQREVMAVLDQLRPKAQQQGKVNAIVQQTDGGLAGDWVESPREQYELWRSGQSS
jgi:3-dehydroquinate dehydratase type I